MRTGLSFITSVAVAYEVLCTLVDAVGIRERGWDYVTYTALGRRARSRQGDGTLAERVARFV